MGDVADEAVEERGPAGRVERFEHDRRARPQFVERELEEPQQIPGLEVLHHLRREEPAERRVGQRVEVTDDVGLGDLEPARAADLDHLVIQIESARGDPACLEQIEEFPSAAADVEDIRRAVEVREVALQPRADRFLRSPELVFEPDVLVGVERRRKRGARRGASWRDLQVARLSNLQVFAGWWFARPEGRANWWRGFARPEGRANWWRGRARPEGRANWWRACEHPFQLPLHGHRRLGRDADERAQLVVRGAEARHARLVALLARHERLPPLRQVFGQGIQRGVHDERLPGGLTVLRVDVERDLLQVDDQPRLEVEQIRDLSPQHADDALDRALRLAVRGHVAVDVVHERRVERGLLLQRRTDDPPDEAREPSLQPACRRRRGADIPGRVERRDLLFVVRGRRVRKFRQPHERVVERGERVVVNAVAFLAFLLQALQRGVERLKLRGHGD